MIDIEYHWLPSDNWDEMICPIFHSLGHADRMPDPKFSRVLVAEAGGRIVGMMVTQFVPHLEPLWIDEEYRGKVSWTRMVHMSEQKMGKGTTYYAFSPDAVISRMCTLVGMLTTGWKSFFKKVT